MKVRRSTYSRGISLSARIRRPLLSVIDGGSSDAAKGGVPPIIISKPRLPTKSFLFRIFSKDSIVSEGEVKGEDCKEASGSGAYYVFSVGSPRAKGHRVTVMQVITILIFFIALNGHG